MTPLNPQTEAAGDVWPEQEAIEAWWHKYAQELKSAVTQERLRVQQEVAARDETIAGLRKSLDEQTTTINELDDGAGELKAMLFRFEQDASNILEGLKLEQPPAASLTDKLLILRDEIQRLRENCSKIPVQNQE